MIAKRARIMRFSNEVKLILISLSIYALVLVIHFIYVRFINPSFGLMISDQIVLYNRGKGILYGELPYRDFYTNAAPLSPYLWAPLVLISMLGSTDFSNEYATTMNITDFQSLILLSYVFRIFFALCIILSGIILYRLEDKRKNKNVFLISLIYTVNPFFLYLVSFWGSDECIVPLLILLPIYLFERRNNSLATLSIIIGTGIKYFPIILAPLIWIYGKHWKERIMQTMLFFVGVLSISLPFYFMDPESFLAQFRDLVGEHGNQGLLTIIQSVFSVNLNQHNMIFQILTVAIICLLGLFFFMKRERWDYHKTAALFLVFFLLYPKMQISYIVLVFPFIFVIFLQKGIKRWVAILFYLSAIVNGEMADILIEGTRDKLHWIILSWINISFFYVTIVILIIIFIIETKTKFLGIEEKCLFF